MCKYGPHQSHAHAGNDPEAIKNEEHISDYAGEAEAAYGYSNPPEHIKKKLEEERKKKEERRKNQDDDDELKLEDLPF